MIAELTEVQIPTRMIGGEILYENETGFLTKTIDANGSVSYQMLTLGDTYGKTVVEARNDDDRKTRSR